jgi:hypothetical protein
MATMNVLDSAGGTVAVEKPLAPGQATMAASRPVAIASDQSAVSVSITSGAASSGTAGTPSADVLTVQGATGMKELTTASVPRSTASGATSSRVVSAATTNATSLKASAGNLVNIDLFNVAAYDVFVKFYNKASAPTVGTDTPVWTIPIKAAQGFSRTFPLGKSFATGIVAGDVTGSIDWI